jgi:HPt (histidine-containing phosphotransfer) domain-containing protein
MTGDAEKFLAAGMDGYVSKPVQTDVLRAEIERLTHSRISSKGENMQTPPNASPRVTVNLQELLARVENDRELLFDLLAIFKDEFPAHLRSLEAAVAHKDAREVARISHILKGMLLNLAVSKAAASIANLEQLARAGTVASFQGALASFIADVQGVLPEMETYMAEARP